MEQDWQSDLQNEIEQLKKDKAALQGELKATGDDEKDNETNASAVKKGLIPFVPTYIQNIDALAHSADSESVRLAANKTLIEWAITSRLEAGDTDANEDFKKLLQKIGKQAQKEDSKK